MSIADRIRLLTDFAGSQTKLADRIGITNSNISKLLTKGGQIRSDTLEAIAVAFPNLNARWLLTGQGPMWLEGEEAEKALIVKPGQEELIRQLKEKEDLLNRLVKMMEQRVNMLEREILDSDPQLGKKLGLE